MTALAPTTLEAETLCKTALLSGPAGARRVLARGGGVAIHADGAIEPIGPLPPVADATATPIGPLPLSPPVADADRRRAA